jgi:hypothetical protein
MAGVVAGAGAGFHWMSLRMQRKSSGMKKDLKEGCEEANDHHLQRAPARLPSASPLAGRLLPLFATELLGVLVLGKEELELAEAWEVEDLVKGWRHPRSLFMELTKGSWPEIMAHIPRNLGSGETPSTERSLSRLGFMLSHIRFDWSRFDCVMVGSFFGFDTVKSELPNESSRNCSSK